MNVDYHSISRFFVHLFPLRFFTSSSKSLRSKRNDSVPLPPRSYRFPIVNSFAIVIPIASADLPAPAIVCQTIANF